MLVDKRGYHEFHCKRCNQTLFKKKKETNSISNQQNSPSKIAILLKSTPYFDRMCDDMRQRVVDCVAIDSDVCRMIENKKS